MRYERECDCGGAARDFRNERGFDPLEATIPKLRAAWGNAGERAVVWPFSVRVFRST